MREKLKAVNKNLDRIVSKEMGAVQASEGQERMRNALKVQRSHQESVVHEVLVLEKQIDNTKHRKMLLKNELRELQSKMARHLADPEAVDKIKM